MAMVMYTESISKQLCRHVFLKIIVVYIAALVVLVLIVCAVQVVFTVHHCIVDLLPMKVK